VVADPMRLLGELPLFASGREVVFSETGLPDICDSRMFITYRIEDYPTLRRSLS
jgi:hypothetical protein